MRQFPFQFRFFDPPPPPPAFLPLEKEGLTECVVSLNGHNGSSGGDDLKLVSDGLLLEDLPTGEGDDSSLDTLLGEGLDGLDDDGDFRSGGDEGDVG